VVWWRITKTSQTYYSTTACMQRCHCQESMTSSQSTQAAAAAAAGHWVVALQHSGLQTCPSALHNHNSTTIQQSLTLSYTNINATQWTTLTHQCQRLITTTDFNAINSLAFIANATQQPPTFQPMSIVSKWLDGSRCYLVRKYASAQLIQCGLGWGIPVMQTTNPAVSMCMTMLTQ